MPWSVIVLRIAETSIAKLPTQDAKRIRSAIAAMAVDPWAGDVRSIVGTEQYRRRVGEWRIIFEVFQSVVTIEIVDVLRRNERTYR